MVRLVGPSEETIASVAHHHCHTIGAHTARGSSPHPRMHCCNACRSFFPAGNHPLFSFPCQDHVLAWSPLRRLHRLRRLRRLHVSNSNLLLLCMHFTYVTYDLRVTDVTDVTNTWAHGHNQAWTWSWRGKLDYGWLSARIIEHLRAQSRYFVCTCMHFAYLCHAGNRRSGRDKSAHPGRRRDLLKPAPPAGRIVIV